jgi:hypothetical protein
VRTIAELTLALVLFRDASRVNLRQLRHDAAVWRMEMRFPKRDLVASALVAVAGLAYVLWASDVVSSVRVAGIVMLVCGFAASASAVVPGFDALVHGNKTYLVVTSLIGVVAVVGGVAVVVAASETGLSLVLGAIVALWAIATVHHALLSSPSHAETRVSSHGSQPTALTH